MRNIDQKFIEDFYKKEYKDYSTYIDTYIDLINVKKEHYHLAIVSLYATENNVTVNRRGTVASIIILCLS